MSIFQEELPLLGWLPTRGGATSHPVHVNRRPVAPGLVPGHFLKFKAVLKD